MSIFEYNEELHMQQERDQAMEEGIKRGESLLLISQIQKNHQKKLSPDTIADVLDTSPELVQEIIALIEQNPEADAAQLHQLRQK